MESVLAFRFRSPGCPCNNVYVLFRIDINNLIFLNSAVFRRKQISINLKIQLIFKDLLKKNHRNVLMFELSLHSINRLGFFFCSK